ncbi:isoprenylcysteine carboxylmethyltransferase family protein [soil metagenome]
MNRAVGLLFGVVVYLLFFATFLYLIAFVGNLPFVPVTVDRGPILPMAAAAGIDLALIVVFGLQHSVMARQGFKRRWTQIIPPVIERSSYVLCATAVLALLMGFWKPLEPIVWSTDNALLVWLLYGLSGLGWVIVLLSTFLLNHFELFGLQQVWLNLRGGGSASPRFRTPFFYKLVRHPLYSGFLLAFWSTPVMTLGHLLFAAGMTAYVLIAIRHEERDLVDLFGDEYDRYRRDVGMLTPRFSGSAPTAPPASR